MTATIARTTKKPVAHVDQLATQLADARCERKKWEQKEAALVEQLCSAHASGIVPTKFTTAGWSFTFQEGRQTVVYPDNVTAAVKALQSQAVEAGITTTKVGSPFWRISPAKDA